MQSTSPSRFRLLLTTLLAFVLPLAAIAQPDDGAAVSTRAVAQRSTLAPGGQLVIAVELAHASGYHTWPAAETQLPEDVDVLAQRTELSLAAAPAWAILDGIQYPPTHPDKVANPDGSGIPLEVPLYSGRAVAFIRIRIAPDAPLGKHTLNIGLYYQACDATQCQMPEDLQLPVTFTIAAAANAADSANEPALFTSFDESKWSATPPVANSPTTPTPEPAPPAAANNAPAVGGATLFGFNLGSSFLLVALASALGGFILNLTPCVLPIIPIKILTLTQHAASRRHAMVLGIWMAIGVVAFWTVIGIPMALISRQFDPSQFIFGIWWVCMLIGLVIALMGLGIMGLFTLNLPQAVYSVDAKADSPLGSFMFGVLTAILGLPCFGFVAGGLLAAAATMPAYLVMTIFVGMGVGMAAPYLVLSAYPQLLKFIPRTGPASELVKQIMGILLVAAAAFFIAASIQVLIADYPYLAGSMQWWATGFFIAIAGVWMTVRTFQITKKPAPRLFFPVLAIAMTLGIGLFANGRFAQDRKDYLAREEALAGTGTTGEVPAGVWLHYTPELLATVRSSGRPVFLDFTASWCITCKALKAGVLDPEPLATTFRDRGIVLIEVDCSSRNSAGSKLLQELGRTGVPTWVIYGPGKSDPIFVGVDTPTVNTVVQSMNAAGVPDAAPNSTANRSMVPDENWQEYTPEVKAASLKAGNPVLVYFSATWCITHGEMTDAVRRLEAETHVLKDRGVLLLNADCSGRNSAGSKLMHEAGLVGVPGWALYLPGLDDPAFLTSEVPTKESVLEAIDTAAILAAAPNSAANPTPDGRGTVIPTKAQSKP